MSSYRDPYYQYHDQSQVLVAAAAFEHGQFGEDRRSKSPTSLINHTGHSPGPLTTPPMSRNHSRLPEQAPSQMIYDVVGNSPSDSPTSIRTPDNDPFEVEMLDASDSMRGFYNQDLNASMVTTQMTQGGLPAIDTNMFLSNDVVDAALNAELASRPRPYQSYLLHNQPTQSIPAAQSYNQSFSHLYTSQPHHQEPWTSQRTAFNPAVPPSGIALFDPVSDFVNYNPYSNPEINAWNNSTADPSYLLSPNDPVAPPPENMFYFPNQDVLQFRQPQYQNHSPVEMGQSPLETRVVGPSPSPDAGGFINYDQSSPFFTEQYNTDQQLLPPSPNTLAVNRAAYPSSYAGRLSRSSRTLAMGQASYPSSHAGQLSRSSSNMGPAPVSPQMSAPSPGGSDGMASYQNSDHGMMIDSIPHDQDDSKPQRLSPDLLERLSPDNYTSRNADTETRTLVAFSSSKFSGSSSDTSHDYESETHSRASKGHNGRPGGRQTGTHLEPTVAKHAHDMRKTVACWHCVLQRDRCGPGDTCDRCVKRSQRPNADCGLGCSRIKLVELAEFFLPSLVTQMHEDAELTRFVSKYIAQWGNQEITIQMTCGQSNMPRIPVKVYEFLPNGHELLVLIQYKTDPKTNQRIMVKKQSPALGMVHINHNEEKKYDKYISEIVDNHISAFGELCWMEDDNDFQHKLFKLLIDLRPKGTDEAKLRREVFRLIVCTFIMSHTLTIAEDTKHASLSKMHSYQDYRTSYVENFTSPRMTNRQLKYFFNRLQRNILSNVLNKLQQIYKSSKGCDKWLAAFIAVIGLCMAHEDQQKTIHLVMSTKATTEDLNPMDLQARADVACREIDSRMGFIMQIFRWKYSRKCNPLRDADRNWSDDVGFADESSITFVRSVAQLVKENIDYLQVRQSVSISETNQTKYTSRLVGQFLLSFWLPQM